MPQTSLEAQGLVRATLRSRAVVAVIALLALGLLSACPRELAVPDARGSMCSESRDCNAGATCGALRACVIGRCETEPSLLLPCDGGVFLDSSIDTGVGHDSGSDAAGEDAGQ